MTQLDNDFIQDLERPRGQWVNGPNDFSKVGQKIGGILLSLEIVPRINPKNGQVVLGQKSGKPRKLYRVRFELPVTERGVDDEGVRIWDANEAGQNAIRDAYKAVGTNELIGGKFEAKVSKEAPDEYSQAEYKVRFEAAPKVVELPDTDDGDDW